MLAMAFLTPMTVPISRVSKVWGRNLSREILSNIGQHSLHLGFEAPVEDHVLQPDHHARHDLLIDGFVDVDWPAHARGKDRAQPFLLRLGEGNGTTTSTLSASSSGRGPSDFPISSMSSSIRC